MKAIAGVAKTAFLGFFSSHILATVLIDSQALLPKEWIPLSLQDLLNWYATSLNDPLMGNAKNLLWLQSLVGLELVFQLPFFVWACSWLSSNSKSYPESFRYGCIAYGGHAATSMVPILMTLITNEKATLKEKIVISSIYIPYLLFPLALLRYATLDTSKDGNGNKKNA